MSEITKIEATELETLWHKEMLQIYADAEAIGYEASGFRGLMASHGPLRAAKMLINMDEPSDGFTELWELKRLDISVEARALKPEFRDLFSTSELRICKQRLADYGWTQNPLWNSPDA
jgi:5-methylcytosine-specific restriction enzyme A